MAHTISVRSQSSGAEYANEVPTKWCGKALAVHRPIRDCKTNETSKLSCFWTITHLETGLAAASLHWPLHDVIKLAKAWDEAFTAIHDPEETRTWPWITEWRYQINRSSPISNPLTLQNVVTRYATAQ